MYAIVAVLFDTPTLLYLHYHRTASEGWSTEFLCDYCFDEFKVVISPNVGNCNFERSCRYNLCLRRPPTLGGSALYAVFHFAFNVYEFTLTSK